MSNAPAHIKFARALIQLRHASSNFSDVSAECGDDLSRHASLLVMQIHNAMIHGASYIVTGRAEEFDHANKMKE